MNSNSNFKDAINKAGDIAQTAVVMVGDLAQEGAVRARRLAISAKLRTDNLRQEERCKAAWREIGKRYYEQYGQEPDAAFAELCLKVDEAKAKIEENNAAMQALREEGSPAAADVETEPETKAEAADTAEGKAEEDEVRECDFTDNPEAEEEATLEDLAADIDQLADELERKAAEDEAPQE